MVNQNVQEALKKFEETIKREIHELKMTTWNIKEELNKDIENLRKKNYTEILKIKSPFSQTKHTKEGHSSRLEQMENRMSEVKIK
jgi:DNA-binding transcriptional regulator GbsR (MarR family)